MCALNITLPQIAPCGTLEGNLEKGIVFCRKTKDLGADIALFPEMWSSNYHIYDRPVGQWKDDGRKLLHDVWRVDMRQTVNNQYREFRDEAEVKDWAWDHYGDLLKMSPKSKLYEDIFAYTGSLLTSVNSLMRAAPPHGIPEFFEYAPGDYQFAYEAILGIADALDRYETPENTVAYPFTQLKATKRLCGTMWLLSRLVFSDKAFLSTTLLRK